MALLLTGCGSCYTNNPREFNDAEIVAAEDHPDCVQNQSDWECDPDTPLPVPSPLTVIKLDPELIHTEDGASFAVTAHLLDANGDPIPEVDTPGRTDIPMVEWFGDGLAFDLSTYGHSANVTVKVPAGIETGNLIITAKAAGATPAPKDSVYAHATVVLAQAAVADKLVDRYDPGAVLNAGLFHRSAGNCYLEGTVTFTGSAPLADFENCESPPGGQQSLKSVAFFSPGQRFKRLASGWTATPATVMRPGQPMPDGLPPIDQVFPIPLRVWRGVITHEEDDGTIVDVSADDVVARAKEYEDVADSVLTRNRVGFTVNITDAVDMKMDLFGHGKQDLTLPDGTQTKSYKDNTCRYIAAWVEEGEFGETKLAEGPHLEVVFVATLGPRAHPCPGHDVILIRLGGVLPNSLVHEIGHNLGLGATYDEWALGHTDTDWAVDAGFWQRNLMWPGEHDETFAHREHVSLGQVFRMNRHESSIARIAPGSQPLDNCGTDADAGKSGTEECPCLVLDPDIPCATP